MTIFVILITIYSGISLTLIWKKNDFSKLEKVIRKISFYSLLGILICIILLVFDLRIKGKYTTSLIGLTFLLSTILLFGLTKKSITKVLSGIMTIPIFIFGIISLFSQIGFMFFHLITFPFQAPIAKSEINSNHNVEARIGGLFSSGESLIITKSVFGIFDKEQYVGNNTYIFGINKIETIDFKEKKAEFLIFQNEKNESKNPIKYKAEIKNVW